MHWITPQRRRLVHWPMADLIITASPIMSSDTVRLPLVHHQVFPASPFDKTQVLLSLATRHKGHKGRSPIRAAFVPFVSLW